MVYKFVDPLTLSLQNNPRENRSFTVEDLGRLHLNQGTKVNITSDDSQ